jgi:outer membrane receptor protein involved in Fe transport
MQALLDVLTESSRAVLAVLATVLLLLAGVSAQSYRGSIRGRMRDATKGAIAGGTVTATNAATAWTRSATTNGQGEYVLAELPAGNYDVTAQATGLANVSLKVLVSVGSDSVADFDMTNVATRKEEVTVLAEAPLLDSTNDVLGEVVENKLVTQLPLNGRDFGKLVALVPGVTVEGSGVAGTEKGFGQFNINGNRDRSNNYMLDGTDNNDPFFNNSALNQVGITGAPASLLPIDAIQEFNLQSQFPAEYGRNSGAAVNILTKSGTNQFHGSVFEFLRNNWFDARNYFNVRTNPDGSPNPQTPFHNNQFGASVGGPIVKDKTFFFAAYEGQRERVGSDFVFLVPTQQQIATARSIALNSQGFINPALDKVLAFFPQPTSFNGSVGTVNGFDNDKNDLNSYLVKVDQNFSSRETLSGRYVYDTNSQIFPLGGLGGFGNGSRLPQFAQTSPTHVQVLSLSLQSTLSNSKINEVRFGYTRYNTSFSSLDSNFDPNSIGLNVGSGLNGLPEFDFGGVIENLGATGFSVPRGRTSQTFQILDNFTWIRGRHTLKFGGEYRRALVDSFNDNLARGIFSFSPTGAYPADPVVDTLIGFYTGNGFIQGNYGNTQRNTFNNGLSFFVQDDFKMRPNLTLNLGLRWEYFGPLGESNGLLSNIGKDGMLALVGTDGLSGAYHRNLHNFGPRVGFAWNAYEKTVIRGGYGLYYDYVPQNLLIANYTNSAGLVVNPIGPKPVVPYNVDYTAYASGSGPIFSQSTGGPFDIFFTPQNFSTPYTQSWNLTVQQEMANAVSLELGYVGSKGTHLVRLLDANQPNAFGVRPNPNYNFMDELAPFSSSTYNALQSTLRIQGAHGLSGFAAYVWSKSLDDASDGIDFNFATAALPQNSYNLAAEHGPSTFDTRHRFTAALTYDIVGLTHGPQWLVRGWSLNAISTVQSGRPIPIINSNDTSGFNRATPSNFHQRPNLIPGVDPVLANWSPSTGYLNPLAFQQPADGTFGNLGRNAIYGPSFWDVDLSMAKNTKLRENVDLQLRFEFFNVFNHPNFALPANVIVPGVNADGTLSNSGPQGIISQTPDVAQGNPGLGGGGPRVIQLGARVTF